MKKYFILAGLVFLSVLSRAQDPQIILKKAAGQCRSVQNGYYEMSRFMKFMTHPDTSLSNFHTYFKKIEGDTLYPVAFHYKSYWKEKYSGDVLYSGENFVTTYIKDSTGTIMAKSQWAQEIADYSHNYEFFDILTDHDAKPLPQDSDYLDETMEFIWLGEEKVNNYTCYHIQVNETPGEDPEEMLQYLRLEKHFWINTQDYIPVQYDFAIDLVMNGDTMMQYERKRLDTYDLNTLTDTAVLTMASLPSYYTLKDFVPYKSPEPLALGTEAPTWELESLDEEIIKLDDLKGRLVLIDFFYKSCYPCMQALPSLQLLHEKYRDQGLQVIGIDPYDKKEDDIAKFLAKRGVTYTVLLGGKEAAEAYHVSGYPTMYMVDPDGKIAHVQVGFGASVEEELDKIIAHHLTHASTD